MTIERSPRLPRQWSTHATFRRELEAYACWYNGFRPHTTLGGRTPEEVRDDRTLPRRRIETRPRWPRRYGGSRRSDLALALGYLEGRRHLPVIELRRAA